MANKTVTSTPFKIVTTKGKTPLFGLTKTEYQKDNNGVLTNPKINYYTETTQSDFQTVPENLRDLNQGGPGGTKYLKKVAEYDPTTKKFNATSEAGADLKSEIGLFNNGKQNQLNTVIAASNTAVTKQENISASSVSNQLFKSNTAPTSPSTDQQQGAGLTTEEIAELGNQINPKNIKARGKYDSVVYPIGLNPQHQDCIKFSIVEYKSSGLRGFGESAAGSRRVDVISGIPGFKDRSEKIILGTITLPIPGGIQDSNTVNWSGSEMGPIEQAFGSVIASELAQGKGTEQFNAQQQQAMKDKEALRQGIISKFVQGAVGGNGVLQRLSGDIINPNLELLFNSPDLRTFSFSFKLSPRSKDEAILVKKIIRTFKQAMSVKRRESSFLLQSPNTFAISYIFRNESHPYLNKFKECALTSCNVNYTPEGNYMSFDDPNHPSMVSYQLDLTFQELEPIYNDDYGTNEKNYENIGF